MKFETVETTPFELEIQITVENAAIEKQSLAQVIKKLSPESKEYKKAMEMLNQEQQKEWQSISKEAASQQNELSSESRAKISNFRKRLNILSRKIQQEAEKAAEKQLGQPIRPKRPGR